MVMDDRRPVMISECLQRPALQIQIPKNTNNHHQEVINKGQGQLKPRS